MLEASPASLPNELRDTLARAIAQVNTVVLGKRARSAARVRMPARRRPPADRGPARRRQDHAGACAGGDARTQFPARAVHLRPAAVRHHRRRHLRARSAHASSSIRGRSSRSCCSPTRSTARRRRRRARCSRRWPRNRSPSTASPIGCRRRSSSIATQNPMDLAGTYPLPDSQLDRFMLRMSMGYPDRDAERAMLRLDRSPRACSRR